MREDGTFFKLAAVLVLSIVAVGWTWAARRREIFHHLVADFEPCLVGWRAWLHGVHLDYLSIL